MQYLREYNQTGGIKVGISALGSNGGKGGDGGEQNQCIAWRMEKIALDALQESESSGFRQRSAFFCVCVTDADTEVNYIFHTENIYRCMSRIKPG